MTASLKSILVTDHTTGWTGQTRATTGRGYLVAAKRIWPRPGKFKGRVCATDIKTNEMVFDEHVTFTKGETA